MSSRVIRSRVSSIASGASLVTLGIGLALAAPASAQDQPEQSTDQSVFADDAGQAEAIVVTGSRIARSGFDQRRR